MSTRKEGRRRRRRRRRRSTSRRVERLLDECQRASWRDAEVHGELLHEALILLRDAGAGLPLSVPAGMSEYFCAPNDFLDAGDALEDVPQPTRYNTGEEVGEELLIACDAIVLLCSRGYLPWKDGTEFGTDEGDFVAARRLVHALTASSPSDGDPIVVDGAAQALESIYRATSATVRRRVRRIALTELVAGDMSTAASCAVLDFLLPIVSGFRAPLHRSHHDIMLRVFLPMHRQGNIAALLPSLAPLVLIMWKASPTLLRLRYAKGLTTRWWPRGVPRSERAVLVEEVAQLLSITKDTDVQKLLWAAVARCLSSEHWEVAMEAARCFHDRSFASAVAKQGPLLQGRGGVLAMLQRNAEDYWHQGVAQECAHVFDAVSYIFDSPFQSHEEEDDDDEDDHSIDRASSDGASDYFSKDDEEDVRDVEDEELRDDQTHKSSSSLRRSEKTPVRHHRRTTLLSHFGSRAAAGKRKSSRYIVPAGSVPLSPVRGKTRGARRTRKK
eukprot:g4851.t1